MKKILFIAILASLAPAFASAQTASPTPPDEDVVKITTSLIQVDVTVTDSKGKIITNLKPEEMEIYENGKKQKISNFSFVSNVRERSESTTGTGQKPGQSIPVPAPKAEQVRRTIALVVDDLTLSFESTYYVRRALKKFVDEQMQDGDLVAIIRTGAGIGALQQFTTDRRQLYAAIERVRWNPVGAGNIGAFAPLEGIPEGQLEEEPQPGERTQEGREREFNDFRESLFATGTLGAINYVVRGMQELPGRKSVLLLSDGFALFSRDASGTRESTRVLDSLRRLVDMANRASVVVYTMDARGLQFTGLTAADDTSGRSAEQIEQAMSDRREKLFETQQGLQYLARQTGGISIINNNDLSSGIRRILDDQSYYLLGYEPDDDTFDPKVRRFNRLEIKVTRPNVKVRYRSGFFGVSDEKLRPPVMTTSQRILNALTSPFSVNGVAVRLNTLFGNDAKGGQYVQSLLHIRAQDLKFTDAADGSKIAVFDVVAMSFGDNGLVIDRLSKTYTMTIKKDAFQHIWQNGFVYQVVFPVKKPGAIQLRIAVHDQGTDKIGSANQFVEVPNLKKNRLVLSSLVLENLTLDDWKKRNAAGNSTVVDTDPLMDTSLRRFKKGTVLNYGMTVFNPKLDPSGKTDLTYKTRLFRDGKVIFEGKANPLAMSVQPGAAALPLQGTISLGTAMEPGDYVLQLEITDNLAKEKRKLAWQFVDFEVIE